MVQVSVDELGVLVDASHVDSGLRGHVGVVGAGGEHVVVGFVIGRLAAVSGSEDMQLEKE